MIPAEAVEAAAKVHQDLQSRRGHPTWDELGAVGVSGQRLRLDYMAAALEAAAPYLLAAAKAEALEDAIEWLRIPSQPGGGFAAGWLKIRAKEYRKGNL